MAEDFTDEGVGSRSLFCRPIDARVRIQVPANVDGDGFEPDWIPALATLFFGFAWHGPKLGKHAGGNHFGKIKL